MNARAQWAQWGGPNRDFLAKPVQLSTTWPEGGPNRLWSQELGDGNSAISVDERTLYTMYRQGNNEVVVALDATDGTRRWEYIYRASFWRDFAANYSPGPHSTPLVVKNHVYTVGVRGKINCLIKQTGKKVWSHDLWKEYGAKPPHRGYASSPVAYKHMLILPVGGPGHGVMAFNLHDGKVVWTSQDFPNAFSSPIIINVDGQDQLVVFVKDLVAGLEPNTGEILWQHPHRTEYGINVSTPVWGKDNLLFVSSAYDSGSRGLRLSHKDGKTSIQEQWFNRKMQIHHGTAVRIDDIIYSSIGDFGPAFLTAVDAKTGQIVLRQRGFAKANLVAVGRELILLDEDGELAIVIPTPDQFEILVRAQIFSTRSWTVPTLVGTTLYARDRKEILALDLRP